MKASEAAMSGDTKVSWASGNKSPVRDALGSTVPFSLWVAPLPQKDQIYAAIFICAALETEDTFRGRRLQG